MEGLFASTSAAACKLARACGFSVSTEAQACLQPQATAGAGEEGAHTQRKLPASDALANIINQQLSGSIDILLSVQMHGELLIAGSKKREPYRPYAVTPFLALPGVVGATSLWA